MSSDQCNGHIVVMKNVYAGIPLLKLLHPHTQKLIELTICIFEDSDEEYTDFPSSTEDTQSENLLLAKDFRRKNQLPKIFCFTSCKSSFHEVFETALYRVNDEFRRLSIRC